MLEKFLGLFHKGIPNGIISDDLSGMEFDYSSVEGVNPDTIPNVSKGEILAFNQGKYTDTKQACTIVNSGRALLKTVSAVYGYKPTKQDIFDMVNYAKTQGYVVGKGWYVYKGVDSVRNYWNNKHPDMKVNSFLINYSDSDFQKILDKGYLLVGSYKGNEAYGKDFRADAILNGKSFGTPSYGHCTVRKRVGTYGESVDDSYTGNFYNVYSLMYPKDIIDNAVWSSNFFFFIPAVDNEALIKKTQKALAFRKTLSDAYDNIFTTEDGEIRNKLHDLATIIDSKYS